MKKSFKIIFAAVLLFILSAPFVSANDDMGIPLDTYTKGGVYIQWGTFDPVFLTYDPLEGGTYLLGSETGYAEK